MKYVFAALALLPFLISPAHADITIGLAGPLTGENAYLGDWEKHGAEMAVNDINMKGGIKGEKLVLREADDACDPKQAVAVANKLVSQGVKFVIGHGCSATSIPAVKVYAEENVFMITPISTNPAVTDINYKNVFRTCGRDDQQGGAVARYIFNHYHGKKIAVADDMSAWGRGIAEEVKKTLNASGIKEDMRETFSPDASDYSAFISRLKQHNIEVAFLGGYHKSVGLIARQMKEQGVPIQIIGGDALTTKDLWAITGPAGEGILMSFSPDPRKEPTAKTVVDQFNRQGIDPDGQTLNAYAAIQVMAEGFRRADTTGDVNKVSAAIRREPIDTVIGRLAFDGKGDIVGARYVLFRWHNGNYAEVSE